MKHSESRQLENDDVEPAGQLASLPVMQRHTGAYIDEQLLLQQRIEAGGPLQRVSLSSFPTPIRYMGYAVVYGIPLIVVALILISLLK
ncbi:hypothetical protein NST84_22580 [Paenibacillus sp. FSL R7-0345]|uniref:hypothetical protein n=1 Tax=Paenibacillus sp. FSL R7-0345 TaxID=2954535 RepID=UPI00315AAA02